jgi:AAA+ ATPase superfamily predicted ATPase
METSFLEKIIGRNSEKIELNEALNSSSAELIAIYGRRRVGKTYLIKNFFQSKKCVFFQMTGIYKGSLAQQLVRFVKEVGETFYGGASIKIPTNWMDAFDELTRAVDQLPKNKKVVLFFDELPWMSTRKSGVISALEYFWNRYWVNDKKIKLIVCGSAASWIIKKIIKNKGGLHNRVTRKIRLLPFNLYETFLYLNHIGYQCNYQQTVKLYMAMGGIPFYLNQIKKNYSVDQNIDNLFFNSNGMLFDEFDEVFSSLFENSEQYKELVALIGTHKDGIKRSKIDEQNKLTGKGGRLTKRLEDLEDAGFITSYIPFGHKKLGIFYRINDEYCYFYLKWLDPIKRQLKQNKTAKYWRNIINTPGYFGWLGYVFENICYKHISQIKKSLNIGENSLASPWRYVPRNDANEKGVQIDLLFDRDDKAISVCEIKYTDKPFAIDKQYADKLKQKIEVFRKVTRTDKQIFLTMISATGLKKTNYMKEMVDGVVMLDDLFGKDE